VIASIPNKIVVEMVRAERDMQAPSRRIRRWCERVGTLQIIGAGEVETGIGAIPVFSKPLHGPLRLIG
jgi:hypothetical protein